MYASGGPSRPLGWGRAASGSAPQTPAGDRAVRMVPAVRGWRQGL